MNSSVTERKAILAERLSLLSPSKVNLFFRVLRKRSDGFHEIASLYQVIDLCDTLEIALADEDLFTCSDLTLSCGPSNLVIKALNLYRDKTGNRQPFRIHLEKRIPMQAGLGGGSGNAATTLWGINALLGMPVSEKDLSSWSAELGADLAIFFSQGISYCTGRGEILQSVDRIEIPSSFWIAKPQEGLSTPLVYQNCTLSVLPSRDPVISLQTFYQEKKEYYNDLEFSAFKLLPSLQKLKDDLLGLGFSEVVMSGSGTAFFCMGDVPSPRLKTIDFFKVQPLHRKEGSWYECTYI